MPSVHLQAEALLVASEAATAQCRQAVPRIL